MGTSRGRKSWNTPGKLIENPINRHGMLLHEGTLVGERRHYSHSADSQEFEEKVIRPNNPEGLRRSLEVPDIECDDDTCSSRDSGGSNVPVMLRIAHGRDDKARWTAHRTRKCSCHGGQKRPAFMWRSSKLVDQGALHLTQNSVGPNRLIEPHHRCMQKRIAQQGRNQNIGIQNDAGSRNHHHAHFSIRLPSGFAWNLAGGLSFYGWLRLWQLGGIEVSCRTWVSCLPRCLARRLTVPSGFASNRGP